MRDKLARESADYNHKQLTTLTRHLGLVYLDAVDAIIAEQPRKGYQLYDARIAAIENRFADQDAEAAKKIEESKPVCKSCGQKIQEGLLPGQVEQVSAAVSGGYSSGKRTKR